MFFTAGMFVWEFFQKNNTAGNRSLSGFKQKTNTNQNWNNDENGLTSQTQWHYRALMLVHSGACAIDTTGNLIKNHPVAYKTMTYISDVAREQTHDRRPAQNFQLDWMTAGGDEDTFLFCIYGKLLSPTRVLRFVETRYHKTIKCDC